MILVDRRIGSSNLTPYIQAPHCLTSLSYADFSWQGHGPDPDIRLSIGVERKTISDLCDSLFSGRLSGHQLIGLLNSYDHIYLLIEGLWRPRKSDGMLETYRGGQWRPLFTGADSGLNSRRYMYRTVVGMLNTLQVIAGTHLVYTSTLHETGHWLDCAYKWWQKPWGEHKSLLGSFTPATRQTISLVKPSLLHRVAEQFRGIGWDRADAIDKHFASVSEFITADQKSLCAVPGIAKTSAKSIIEERSSTNGRK